MRPLERLGVAAVVPPARCVADVADRRRAGVLIHQGFGISRMIQLEHLRDGADVPVGRDELLLAVAVARHSRRKLSPVLDIQQQPGHQPRHVLRILPGRNRARFGGRKVINRGYATLVIQLGHEHRSRYTILARRGRGECADVARRIRFAIRCGTGPKNPTTTHSPQSYLTGPGLSVSRIGLFEESAPNRDIPDALGRLATSRPTVFRTRVPFAQRPALITMIFRNPHGPERPRRLGAGRADGKYRGNTVYGKSRSARSR